MEFLFATISFFIVTTAASFIYISRIKEARTEYENSKDIVRSITVGFSRQLKKVVGMIGSAERSATEANFVASEAMKTSTKAIEAVRENSEKVSQLSNKQDETEKAITSLREEIQTLARRRPVVAAGPSVDAPIPLRRDAVLDQLTPTEMEFLMLIEEVGEASGPAIRERVNKTREHTARLLKKLFDSGFIDRNTSGMPYRYSVRKEIRELIRQQKESAQLSV